MGAIDSIAAIRYRMSIGVYGDPPDYLPFSRAPDVVWRLLSSGIDRFTSWGLVSCWITHRKGGFYCLSVERADGIVSTIPIPIHWEFM